MHANTLNHYEGKRVLIIGGAGFIGSNLAHTLVNCGASITVVDSMNPNYGGNLYNLKGISHGLKINFSDIRDIHSLPILLKDVDYVFNMAGQTSHMDSMKDPVTDLEINALAQLTFLEALRDLSKQPRVVFASTRQIYGVPRYLPVDEEHPVCPVDVNGINKFAGESYYLLYSRVYGVKATVLRLTNTYGPRMRIKDARQTFLGVWVRNLLLDSPIEVWGGGQRRDYLYVSDLVEALIETAISDKTVGNVYNIGGNEVLTLAETAKIFASQKPCTKIEIHDFPPERKKIDIGDYFSESKKFFDVTGWQPKIKFSDGIAKTINYYINSKEHYL